MHVGAKQVLKVETGKLHLKNHMEKMAWVEKLEKFSMFLFATVVSFFVIFDSYLFMFKFFNRNSCWEENWCSEYYRN